MTYVNQGRLTSSSLKDEQIGEETCIGLPQTQLHYLAVFYCKANSEYRIMQIIARCPLCGFSWLLDNAIDRRIRCRNCRKLFKTPKLEEVHKAVNIISSAKGPCYVDEQGKTYG